jgi:hypothetical protein
MEANLLFKDLLRSDFHKKFMVSPVHLTITAKLANNA